MIETIEIENYRCFESLQLKNLRRMNVIVGQNSVGKTALMESIFLASGANPELVFRIKSFRGLNSILISNTKSAYEALWKDLFHGFDQSKTIKLSLSGSPAFCRDLFISYQKDKTLTLEFEGKDYLKDSISPISPILFEWKLLSNKVISAEPEIKGTTLNVKLSEPLEPLPIGFYASSINVTQEENAHYFSSLSVKNLEGSIIEALNSEFPFINGLSVEIWSGVPTLFASVDGVDEKIPLNIVSSGVNKLIGILLGIANLPGGIVCIDELENGFYYDRLPSIWKIIHEFAVKFNVQIFASTHSWECLKAVTCYAESASNSSEFTLIQASKRTSGFKVHDGRSMIDAINQEIEVR